MRVIALRRNASKPDETGLADLVLGPYRWVPQQSDHSRHLPTAHHCLHCPHRTSPTSWYLTGCHLPCVQWSDPACAQAGSLQRERRGRVRTARHAGDAPFRLSGRIQRDEAGLCLHLDGSCVIEIRSGQPYGLTWLLFICVF